MPRTLPWLTEPKAKTRDPLSTSSSGAPKRKRDASPPSDQDLVDPDRNTTGVSTPARRAKRRLRHLERSPSTSPPPAPPSVEYMREGYGADDAWMMVEDEFFATAQMFTQHLHHAAYSEQKRRAQARGETVLRTLGRPTDGRIERNGMAVEREERDKGIKEALGWDKEDDDGDLTDPLLGALMNDPKRMGRALEGVGKVKSRSRAANGFEMSPEKKHKRTFPAELNDGHRDLDDQLAEAEADSDDLDGPASQNKQQSASFFHDVSSKPRNSPPNPRRQTDVFKKFVAVANEETRRPTHKPDRSAAEHRTENGRHGTPHARRPSGQQSNKPATTSIDDFEHSKPNAREETPAYLVKRRQRKEEEEKRKTKEKKAAIAVPTFML